MAPERQGEYVCVWARVCMCMFASVSKDLGYMIKDIWCLCHLHSKSSYLLSWQAQENLNGLGTVIPVLFILQSWDKVERSLQVREPVAVVRLRFFLLQEQTKLGTQLSPRWPGNFVFSPGNLVPPSPAALLLLAAAESGWLPGPCGRGYGWMAQGCTQQPPLI